MRIIFYIFALLFLSCQEETIVGVRQCGTMVFSDALPVQWWTRDCETFNEHEAQGVHHVCWCQPWLCDKQILTQFIDETSTVSPSIVAQSSDGSYHNIGFFDGPIELAADKWLYQHEFIPEDFDVCDGEYLLKIFTAITAVSLNAPSDWTNDSVQTFDTKSATTFEEVVSAADSEILVYQPANVPSGTRVVVTLTVEISNVTYTVGGFTLLASLRNSSGVSVSTRETPDQQAYTASHVGTFTQREIITVDEGFDATRLYLRLSCDGSTNGSATVVITMDVGNYIYIPDDEFRHAKTDCLNIRETHDETISFEYSNERNFSGIIYQNQSPDLTLNILVPCRFYHEKFIQEDQGIELTTSVITTSSQKKKQRKLQVQHAPYYFHNKLIEVLQHQSVIAKNKSWKKQEAYEVSDGNDKWPLKTGVVMLTEKDSIIRNVI